jgi:hypothetical protein
MACVILEKDGVQRRIAPGRDNQYRYTLQPGEQLVGVDWACHAQAIDNMSDMITNEGVMVGNIIKKVTNALGMKQCMACQGRQRRYNEAGLAIQQKIKELF